MFNRRAPAAVFSRKFVKAMHTSVATANRYNGELIFIIGNKCNSESFSGYIWKFDSLSVLLNNLFLLFIIMKRGRRKRPLLLNSLFIILQIQLL